MALKLEVPILVTYGEKEVSSSFSPSGQRRNDVRAKKQLDDKYQLTGNSSNELTFIN